MLDRYYLKQKLSIKEKKNGATSIKQYSAIIKAFPC